MVFILIVMSAIEIKNLSKSYRVYQKQEGMLASVRGLFHREYREVHAVRDISLTVEPGEFVAFSGPERSGENDDAEIALRRDQSRLRQRDGVGTHALGAGKRIPPPVCVGDGSKESALVGLASAGIISA
jgi:hypothetical protein